MNKTHDIFLKYYKQKNKFESQLAKKDMYRIFISYEKNSEDDNKKLFAFLNKRKKTFIRINQMLLKLLLSMKNSLNLKTFKKFNVTPYKKAIKNKDIKQILIENFNINKRLRYFLSYFYQNSYIFTNIKKIKNQYYYKVARYDKHSKCINNNCKTEDREELNKEFAKQFYFNTDSIKAIKAFVKTKIFRDYYECLYNKCIKEVLLYYRSYLTHLYVINSIKSNKMAKKYHNDYSKIRKSLSYAKIKSFDDFLKVVTKYSIFIKAMLKIK